VGIGTATSSPYNAFGLVSSTSGRGTGIGLTSAQWNKKRTDWVTASDTSAIGMYIDTAGGPRMFMRAVDGDSLGITLDGTIIGFKSNTDAKFLFGDGNNGIQFTGRLLYPTSTDAGGLGTMSVGFQSGHITDNWYIGGKGQTATQYISQENTIAGQDSSMKLWIDGGNPKIDMKSGYAGQNIRQQYFGPDTLALFNGARTGRDSTVYVLPNGSLNISGTTTATLLNIKQNQAELITAQVNRDFSGAGNWTGANWAVSGGKFVHTAGNTAAATLAYTAFTASSILSGYPYELTFTVSGLTAGTVTPALGTYAYSAITTNGTYTIYINASADNVNLTFTPTSPFDGALDNISMKYVENAQYVKGGILYHSGVQSVGGNARGIGATDLQVYRTSPTQVASGIYSTASGYASTASGIYATASGSRSTASGNYSTASGNYSTASGSYSTASGSSSTASGYASTASGYYSTASQYGSRAHAAGRFAAAGDAQFSAFVLRDTTLSSQADTLKLDGSEAETTGYLTIDANQALYFEGKVIAWVITGTKDNMAAAYKIEGLIQRDGSNNTTLVWSAVTDKYEHADLAAALSVTLSANDTKECLNIICAGMYEQTIRWVATIDAVQVGG
jgi:hypothetical protein